MPKHLANLDAMIARMDFAEQDAPDTSFENLQSVSVRDFTSGGLLGPSLRKPDFQRETNHWTPEQVATLLECYVSGDLIPSVILWRSRSFVFVIDGGHRLSVLRAWVEDDYGDGPISQAYFGFEIGREQKRAAKRTRELVDLRVGSWQHFQSRLLKPDLTVHERSQVNTVGTRAIPVQWVTGNPDKAESSFFRINTEGTPLDEIEELLLKQRRKPVAIAARAVIRAGHGHRYWSRFADREARRIEEMAAELHSILFEPSIDRPLKTLALPLGGAKGVRAALQVLIDFIQLALRGAAMEPGELSAQTDDESGSGTIEALEKSLRLAKRITGNDSGSLGLHPAVYYYGPSGRHSASMFLSTVSLIARHLANNDKRFFRKFTEARARVERALIDHRELIASVLQKMLSKRRTEQYERLLAGLVDAAAAGKSITEEWIVRTSGLTGKALTGTLTHEGTRFSDDVKSEIFINTALTAVPKCPICQGYLDVEKSVSYDHLERVEDGGRGEVSNGQLTHPYCNQSIKR